MDDLFVIIKQIALNAVSSSKPCDWCYGYVKDTNPLTVSISDKLEIDQDFIELGSKELDGIETGDKLILLRKAGGQLFLCIDIIR